MIGFGKQFVEPDISAFWRARSASLHFKLTEDPAAREAWFWRIQVNIVDYLLHRYGSYERQHLPLPDEQATAAEPSTSDSATVVGNPALDSPAMTGDTGKQPRPPEEIRPVLHFISRINQYRYENLQRVDNEIAEALRFERERIRDTMPQIVRARRSVAPEQGGETEDSNAGDIATACVDQVETDEQSGAADGTLGDREAADIVAGKVVVESVSEDAIKDAEPDYRSAAE